MSALIVINDFGDGQAKKGMAVTCILPAECFNQFSGLNYDYCKMFGYPYNLALGDYCRDFKMAFSPGNLIHIEVHQKHIFQKVKFIANVPIKIYCKIGFFRSIIIIIKDFFGSKS